MCAQLTHDLFAIAKFLHFKLLNIVHVHSTHRQMVQLYASAARAATKALCFCPVRSSLCPSVPCLIYFFRFARVLNAFLLSFFLLHVKYTLSYRIVWNLPAVTITMNILNIYIWAKLEQKQRRQNIRTDVSRFCLEFKQVLTPDGWIHKFSAQTKTSAIADTMSR